MSRAAAVQLGLVLLALAAGCGGQTTSRSSGGPPASTPGAPAACRGARSPRRYDHVVLLVLENHSFQEIEKSSPHLDALAADCGLAAHYSAVAHPSLPNYLALTSGSTQGISSDCTDCRVQAPSIFGQLQGDWRSYLESIPAAGFTGAFSGYYAKKHNPAAYYTGIAREYARRAVPLGSSANGALARDLRRGTLRRFSLIVPNLCNDEHDCAITVGDHWLHTWIPLILHSPAYKSGRTLLVITYDEGADIGNRVYTVAVNPSIPPGTIIRTPLTHYSLLKTVQQLLRLPCLAHSCDTTTNSMIRGLHL